MKDLKRGDFVWHKELGRGIVHNTFDSEVLEVQFENKKCYTMVNRHAVFAKGDVVKIKTISYNTRWHRDVYTFFEPMMHNPKCESSFTVKEMGIGRIKYCTDIKHHREKAKTIDFSSLEQAVFSQALNDCPLFTIDVHQERADREGITRKEAKIRNYAEIYGAKTFDNTDTEKEKLLKRIEILELKAKIKELEDA